MSQPERPARTSARIAGPVGKPPAPVDVQVAHDLTRFTLADMVRCGEALRLLATEATSMEKAAQAVTRYLYENLRKRNSDNPSCVLVRFFRTLIYARLATDLREAASQTSVSAEISEDTKCLTLLATAGDDPRWNSRHTSTGHKCIPLISEAIVERFPMISQLIRQLGLTTSELLRTTPELIKELDQRNFGVFHVPMAINSPFVPAQADFVASHGVSSVLGFGGMLPDGDLFAVIIFARVAIPSSTADMFRTIALNLKVALLDLLDKPVFAD
jgi:two-component system NtrC family sensor kinase